MPTKTLLRAGLFTLLTAFLQNGRGAELALPVLDADSLVLCGQGRLHRLNGGRSRHLVLIVLTSPSRTMVQTCS